MKTVVIALVVVIVVLFIGFGVAACVNEEPNPPQDPAVTLDIDHKTKAKKSKPKAPNAPRANTPRRTGRR